MGYRGKVEERARARELRARAWTLPEIAAELGVAKSSVSVWVRDVAFDPASRRSATTDRRPRGSDHPLRRRKLAEIERCRREGAERVGRLSDREFLVAGRGLYAGDGQKGEGRVKLSNSDPRIVAFFCAWFRHFFDVDESRLRLTLYLHDGLDLTAAVEFWSGLTAIPAEQFSKSYRAVPDATIRHTKHTYGCAHVAYACTRMQRELLGLMHAVLDAGVMAPGAGLEPATFRLTVERSAN